MNMGKEISNLNNRDLFPLIQHTVQPISYNGRARLRLIDAVRIGIMFSGSNSTENQQYQYQTEAKNYVDYSQNIDIYTLGMGVAFQFTKNSLFSIECGYVGDFRKSQQSRSSTRLLVPKVDSKFLNIHAGAEQKVFNDNLALRLGIGITKVLSSKTVYEKMEDTKIASTSFPEISMGFGWKLGVNGSLDYCLFFPLPYIPSFDPTFYYVSSNAMIHKLSLVYRFGGAGN